MEKKYSAIIPVYNSEKSIIKLINSLINLEKPPFEIIVIDDASTDETFNSLKKYKQVNVFRLEKNVGPALARNIGARKAKTSWLLFIDADCSLPYKSIDYAFPSQEEEEKNIVGIMGVFDIKGKNKSLISNYKNIQRHFEIKAMKNPPDVFSSSCFTINKRPFFECGGFNEDFGKNPTEDNEFYFRLIKKKLFIKYNTKFSFFHNKKMSLKKLFYDDFTRAKAIIHNIFGNLGEKRNSLGIEELIRWIFELLTGCLISVILFLFPVSFLFLPVIYLKLFLIAFFSSVFIMVYINYEFFKFSLKTGGLFMLYIHLFLRIFEMVTAVLGIFVSIFQLVLKYSNRIRHK